MCYIQKQHNASNLSIVYSFHGGWEGSRLSTELVIFLYLKTEFYRSNILALILNFSVVTAMGVKLFSSLFVARQVLLVVRYFLPVACQFLLVVHYFLPVACYFLLVARWFLLVACYFFPVARYFLFVARYFLLDARYFLFVVCYYYYFFAYQYKLRKNTIENVLIIVLVASAKFTEAIFHIFLKNLMFPQKNLVF